MSEDNNKNPLSRDAILSKGADLKTKVIEAFGGTVTIRQLTSGKGIEMWMMNRNAPDEAVIHWVIASVVDPETLAPVFTEQDIPALKELSLTEIGKISTACQELNGANVDTTVKNSQASPNGVSATV